MVMNILYLSMFVSVSFSVHKDKNKTEVYWLFSKWSNVQLFFQIMFFHLFILTYEPNT